ARDLPVRHARSRRTTLAGGARAGGLRACAGSPVQHVRDRNRGYHRPDVGSARPGHGAVRVVCRNDEDCGGPRDQRRVRWTRTGGRILCDAQPDAAARRTLRARRPVPPAAGAVQPRRARHPQPAAIGRHRRLRPANLLDLGGDPSVSHTLSRRQFAFALAALMQAPVRQQTGPPADAQAEGRQRQMAIAAQAAALRAELAKSGAGSWDRWVQRLAPLRAEWKVVAAGTLKGHNGYIFNKNALDYLVDEDLEAGVKDTRPLESLAGFDSRMKKERTDFIWVPIPSIEE